MTSNPGLILAGPAKLLENHCSLHLFEATLWQMLVEAMTIHLIKHFVFAVSLGLTVLG